MPVFIVASEMLSEVVPILDYGQGPMEDYRIVEIVVAKSREQARYLAWQTDSHFDRDVRDMPNFRTRKLADHLDTSERGVVSDWDAYQKYWQDPKSLDLLKKLD